MVGDPFYAPICTSSKVFFFPISANHIYEVDVNVDTVKKSEVLDKQFCEIKKMSLQPYMPIMMPKLQEEYLTFLTYNGVLFEYNIVTNEMKSKLIYLDESIEEKNVFLNAVYSDTIN